MTRTFCFSKELAWKYIKSPCESLLHQIIKSYSNKHNKSVEKIIRNSNSAQIPMVLIILRPSHPMQSHTCWLTNNWQIRRTLRAESIRFFILEPDTILQLCKIWIKTMVWRFVHAGKASYLKTMIMSLLSIHFLPITELKVLFSASHLCCPHLSACQWFFLFEAPPHSCLSFIVLILEPASEHMTLIKVKIWPQNFSSKMQMLGKMGSKVGSVDWYTPYPGSLHRSWCLGYLSTFCQAAFFGGQWT